ncbi:hypothetical protein L6164_022073 [Bauhinia variegata]|uniref:Uncharacterized protein n=1 Tax=Bauhinia variegata TaxID=167791 RepID=A0ACB9MHC9_BAUVA|nr:hypothetical protein L6164_022073 [Bauhinia variegata]
MAEGDATKPSESQREEAQKNEATKDQEEDPNEEKSSSEDSDSDSESDSSGSYFEGDYGGGDEAQPILSYRRGDEAIPEAEDTPEANLRRFSEALESSQVKKMQEDEIRNYKPLEERWNFPKDPENWMEQDLRELWADAPLEMTEPGWDPAFYDEDDWEFVQDEIAAGRRPPIAPFYLPYRKPYPAIPNNHYDISNPKATIEELDRIEEFLIWVSYIFADGSSYEGTVWDDLAHGKGVYVAEKGLVRYEGEWFQNTMEGHGVVEVDIPDIEPAPGSELEAKMRAEGKIISRDYMSPEDREWLEMDIEDSYRLANGAYEIPFYENDEWVKQFGRKPEKGRYRYAGQWKHGRMHGCGVYEINERTIYGRFYFGELLDDDEGCDDETSALHAGIAEVAAAKARMFVNKPDGMVREQRGPYGDPQHPYFYEEEDTWMAPGFINQFYEVPDYWKMYVHDVDQEREMWLNSFYKAPLRLPMPAELEYWWSKYETPEFVLINKEPEPDPEDPSKLIYSEDPLILHTPTGNIINYVEDEEHGIRLFWQPPLEKGEDVDPEKARFLPLGFDEFFGREKEVKGGIWNRLVLAVENKCKPFFDKIEKWTEEQKKSTEMKKQAIEEELELIEAELCLEEAVEDLDELLRRKEKEEEEKAEMGFPGEEDNTDATNQDEKAPVAEEEQEEEEEEDDDDDEITKSSFGSVKQEKTTDRHKGKKPSGSPFATSSFSFASFNLVSGVPPKLQNSFSLWKKGGSKPRSVPPIRLDNVKIVDSVSFPTVIGLKGSLKALGQTHGKAKERSHLVGRSSGMRPFHQTRPRSLASGNSMNNLEGPRGRHDMWLHAAPESDLDNLLSLHTLVYKSEAQRETTR